MWRSHFLHSEPRGKDGVGTAGGAAIKFFKCVLPAYQFEVMRQDGALNSWEDAHISQNCTIGALAYGFVRNVEQAQQVVLGGTHIYKIWEGDKD